MRNGIRADLEKNVEEKMKNDKIHALLAKLKGETEITVPKSMLDAQLDQAWRNFYRQSGLTEEQLLGFLKMQDTTKEALLDSWRDSCTSDLKDQLILEKIKEKENFEIPEDEFKAKWEERYSSVGEENKEYYENILRDELQFERVVPFLLENNTFKAGKEVSYESYLSGSYAEE